VTRDAGHITAAQRRLQFLVGALAKREIRGNAAASNVTMPIWFERAMWTASLM
jgi:hypothetical protein